MAFVLATLRSQLTTLLFRGAVYGWISSSQSQAGCCVEGRWFVSGQTYTLKMSCIQLRFRGSFRGQLRATSIDEDPLQYLGCTVPIHLDNRRMRVLQPAGALVPGNQSQRDLHLLGIRI
jgi:hypothetical protein